MSDNTFLTSLASDTLNKLRIIWDEVGLDADERKTQIQQLANDVAYVYNDRLKMEEEHKETMKAKIVSYVEKTSKFAYALGEMYVLDSNFNSLSLKQRFEHITNQFDEYERQYEERVILLEDLHERLHSLWRVLGMEGERDMKGEFKEIGDDLTLNRVKRFEEQIQYASEEKIKRETVVHDLIGEIQDLWAELVIGPNPRDDFEQAIAQGMTMLSTATIAALRSKKEELQIERNRREEQVKEYATKIVGLWQRLDVSDDEKKSFFETNVGLGSSVISACQTELKRLELLRKERVKGLIENARNQINALWEELHLSEVERLRFKPAHEEIYTEESLDAHESEIRALEEKAQLLRPIMSLIDRRESILMEKVEFEATASDPTRLLSKKRDPGRLLREEKFRRTIEKEYPKLEETLKKKLKEWEDANHQPLLVRGQRYLDVMLQQEESEKLRKEEDKLRRERDRAFKTMDPSELHAALNTSISSSSSSSLSKASTPTKSSNNNNNNNRPGTAVKSNTLRTPKVTPRASVSVVSKGATVSSTSGKALLQAAHASSSRVSSATPMGSKQQQSSSLMSTTPLFASSPSSSMSVHNSPSTPTASKKRPFGTNILNATISAETSCDRAKKSLRNLGINSPGNENLLSPRKTNTLR